MKVLVVAVFACVIGVAMCGPKFKEMTDACIKESGVGGDVWMDVENQKLDDPKLPDFLFCAFQKFNFLNDKGEYQIDEIKGAMTRMVGEDVANKFIEECAKEAKATGPETALAMVECSHEIAPKIK